MKKKEWNKIHMPKLLIKKGKVTVTTVKKASSGKSGTQATTASMMKGFVPIKPANTQATVASMKKNFKAPPAKKKPALTRNDYLSAKTEQGTSKWSKARDTIIGNRGTTMMPVTKWVDIPKGMEVTEGGKLEKAEGHDLEGIRQRKVTTMEDTGITRWKDAYTGETITDPNDIHIDHTVSIDRAKRSGAFKKLGDAQGFGTYLKNLVITKGSTNKAKGAKDLGDPKFGGFEPTHEPKKYAQRYGDVMSSLGLVMTYGEGRAYKKHTGEEPKSQVQHILDMQRGEPIAETQTRHDMWMMRARKK